MNRSFFKDFNKLTETVLAYRSAKPLLVALHYDVFTRVAEGADTAPKLAARLKLDPRASRIFLDALAGLGYLDKQGGSYRNTREASRLLVNTSPQYVGNSLKYQELTWDAWSDMRHVLKSGKPRRGLVDWIRQGFFTADYIKAMGDVSREPCRELAARLDWRGVRRSLDVGCGAGNASAAFVERAPKLQADLLDMPVTLKVTRSLLAKHPCRDRLRFKQADFMKDEFGREEYDLVLISNVTRVEDEKTNRALVGKAFRALKAGGRLVIHDFAVEPDRTKPKFSVLLGLHVLLFTGKGEVYTLREYRHWLKEAGFRGTECFQVAKESLHPSWAVIGRKPA